MYYRFPSGFFVFLVLLFCALVVSLPVHGEEIVISETIWNGIKLEYSLLKKYNETLRGSLNNSAEIILSLEQNSAELSQSLTDTNNLLQTSEKNRIEAERQVQELGSQLEGLELSLKKATGTIRKEKVKVGLISGAVGLVLGAVIIGIIIGG